MNVLFLTLIAIDNLEDRGIYHDLLRKFRNEGHKVVVVSPLERGKWGHEIIKRTDNEIFLRVKTLKIQKSSIVEKGIGTLLLQIQFNSTIKKYLYNIKFDLIIYSTPPITFASVIAKIKKRDKAKCYLLLKDIFPQNAVDLGFIKNNSLLHKYFLKKEKHLYLNSDFIGCMSPANKSYLLEKHPELLGKVEVNPNSIEVRVGDISKNEFVKLRKELNIPVNRTVFIYGGNLGKPQGIEFLMEILESNELNKNVYFIIIGDGTEYLRLEQFILAKKFTNVIIKGWMENEEYEKYLQVADVGLIFLNKNFTIPNFPSRLLSYLEKKKPVLCATDTNTDIGKIAEDNEFGFWCENGDIIKFNNYLNIYTQNGERRETMGKNGFNYLVDNYHIESSYKTILSH
ncbi:MAG: glycosyltransferase family 4 protein [Bacteroidota bacterium]